MKQNLRELEGKMNKFAVIIADLNIPFSTTPRKPAIL